MSEPTTETCVNCTRLKPRNTNDTALCLHCNRRFDFGEDGIGIDYFEKSDRNEPTTRWCKITEADKVIIDGCAMAIMSGTLDANEIQSNAEQIHNRIGGIEVNPTTSILAKEIRRANEIYMLDSNLLTVAADRLESQEQKVAELTESLRGSEELSQSRVNLRAKAIIERDEATARAEKAERERDAAKTDCEIALQAVSNYGVCHLCQFVGRDGFCARKGIGIGCKPKWRGLPQDGEGV